MAARKHLAEQEPVAPAPLIGRDEMNLAEFPIALVADRAPTGQKTLYFEDKHGRLTVTASDKYGLPTAADADMIVALIYLTKLRNGFKDLKVNFSRYELIKLLNWRDESDSYRRLDLAFNRWGGVWLVYDKCWWNNRLKCYTSAKMHIIENVEIIDNDARRKAHLAGQSGLPLSSFKWDEKFIESCQADNLRLLDLDEYFSLKSAVSKRLYRFLGKRFYLQRDWTFDLHDIAFERVGLSRSYSDAYKIKEKLQPAIDELEAIGFLRPLNRDDRYTRIDRGQWTIRLTRQSPTLTAPQQSPLPQAEREPPLVAELVKRGVTRATAIELVQKHPAETIQAKIEQFDWRMTQPKPPKKPAGYLVKSILDGYNPDPDFMPKSERERQAKAKRQNERKAAEDLRQKRESDAREEAMKKAVDAYIQRLAPAEREALKAEALAHAGEQARQNIDDPAMRRYRDTLMLGLLREHVQQLLQGK